MTNIPSTGQNFVSTFDNENALLYFDILTKKTHELDFDSHKNVYLSISFKMIQESPQSDTCN